MLLCTLAECRHPTVAGSGCRIWTREREEREDLGTWTDSWHSEVGFSLEKKESNSTASFRD